MKPSSRSPITASVRFADDTGHPTCVLRSVAFALLATCSSHALAESSAPPQPTAPATGAPSSKGSTASSEQPGTPAVILPSRYVQIDDLKDYLENASQLLSIKNRKTDPFGQFQDIDAKPPEIKIAKPTHVLQTKIDPLQQIISQIRVSAVMPADHRFMIGTRTFKQGDRFPLTYQGRKIQVEITSVSPNEIKFKGIDLNESASLKLDMLPPGMTPGNDKIMTPGMVREQKDSPLVIEPSNPLQPNPRN